MEKQQKFNMAFQPQNDLNVNYLDFLIQELDSQELDLNFSSHESVDDINLIQDSHQNLNHSVDYTLMIQGDQDVLTQFDEQTKESHEFERFEYVIRPWKQEALEYLKNKHPQIYLKNSALAAAVVIKFLRTRLILTNCKNLAFGISKTLQTLTSTAEIARNMQMATNAGTQVSSNLVKASEVIVEKMTRQPDQISQQVAQVTSLDVLRESVKASGGNVQSSVKIFKDSITNKTTWAITAAIFVSEVAVLTWQRFVSNSIDTQTYKDRVKASFLSNTAGVIGGSMGACIGSLIGNLIAPGVGGFVGSLLGGLFASVGSQILVDQYFDSKSYSLEEYEKYEISDEMKYESYLKACEKIQIPAGATKAQIEQQTKIQYLRFHPDKTSQIIQAEKIEVQKQLDQELIFIDVKFQCLVQLNNYFLDQLILLNKSIRCVNFISAKLYLIEANNNYIQINCSILKYLLLNFSMRLQTQRQESLRLRVLQNYVY